MSQAQHITDYNDGRKYFAQLPHLADDDLDMYEYRLYGHYVRVCGQGGGTCQETERTTYTHCGMGREKFRSARQTLVEKGFISIIKYGTPHKAGQKGSPTVIAINDIWLSNIQRYSKPSNKGLPQNPSTQISIDKGSETDSKGLSQCPSPTQNTPMKGSETDSKGLSQMRKKNKEIKTTDSKNKITTTPTATSLSSSLLSTSQSGESVSDSDEQAIATTILDLFSTDRARQLVQEHGYETIYRACCYVAHANRDKPKDKHLSPRFVFGELNGAGNIPENYSPPEDYAHDAYIDYGHTDAESRVGNHASEAVQDADPVPEPKAVVEAKPTPAPKPAIQSVSDQSPEASAWRGVVVQVKAQHPAIHESYLQPVTLRCVQHNTYVVEVKDALARDALQGRYYRLFKALLTGVTGVDVAIRFCVAGEVVSIEPLQPDPEPDKPIKVEPVVPAPVPRLKPQLVRTVQADDKPVTPEQMMAGRRLFNQLVQARTMGADAAQGKVVELSRGGGLDVAIASS